MQRIRLATQIGSGLTGVLYVLDEPTIGLHPRDNERLIATLKGLRDKGTKQLFTALTIIGIKLCDHIIFAPNGEFSFFNEGIIDGFYKDANYDNSSPRNTVNSPQINFYKD